MRTICIFLLKGALPRVMNFSRMVKYSCKVGKFWKSPLLSA